MPVKLRDVAKAAGLSTAAVSYALRGSPKVSPATRERVRALAARMGYVPDTAAIRMGSARQLPVSERGMGMAMIEDDSQVNRPPDHNLMRQASARAAAMGYAPSILLLSDYPTPQALERVLSARRIEAVLLGPLFRRWLAIEMDWSPYSVVACRPGYWLPPVDAVMPDTCRVIAQSICTAAARGYERIGIVYHPEPVDPVDSEDILSGFLLGRQAVADRAQVSFRRIGDPAALDAWVRAERLDAVLCQTATFCWMLRDLGYRIAKDIGTSVIIHHSKVESTTDEWAGFDNEVSTLASRACQLLDSKVRQFIRGTAERPARLLISAQWIEGASLPEKAKAKVKVGASGLS